MRGEPLVELAVEEAEPRDLGREPREVAVRVVALEHGYRATSIRWIASFDAVVHPQRLAALAGDARGIGVGADVVEEPLRLAPEFHRIRARSRSCAPSRRARSSSSARMRTSSASPAACS